MLWLLNDTAQGHLPRVPSTAAHVVVKNPHAHAFRTKLVKDLHTPVKCTGLDTGKNL